MNYDYAFTSLPAYLGGKRRLARLIFSLLAEVLPEDTWPSKKLLDPFLGGGSVSLLAKLLGFEVHCNDLAARSAVIGQALIANGSERLALGDLAQNLSPLADFRGRAEKLYVGSVFPIAHARLLDRALRNAQRLPEPKLSLATLLIIKWCLRIQPMSQLRGTDARAAAGGDFDRVSPRRLKHYLDAGKLLKPDAWIGLMAEVNGGVFPGRGSASQGDAFTFLKGHAGDVVYLDPPYPGTTSYEREYAVLDDLLEGTQRSVSGFSKSPDLLKALFKACNHVPIWLVSLNNAALSLAELESLIHHHRANIRALAVPYRHLGSIASEEKNASNREFIVLAW